MHTHRHTDTHRMWSVREIWLVFNNVLPWVVVCGCLPFTPLYPAPICGYSILCMNDPSSNETEGFLRSGYV